MPAIFYSSLGTTILGCGIFFAVPAGGNFGLASKLTSIMDEPLLDTAFEGLLDGPR